MKLTRLKIENGRYFGAVESTTSPTPIDLYRNGENCGTCEITQQTDGLWQVAIDLPDHSITQGHTDYLLVQNGSTDILDSFSISVSCADAPNLETQLRLLREELNMLKSAFRRQSRK
ncbi:hypothetical protein GCM10007939_18500 [Amylibacter marinus]|uniref:Uncharacterized protein n=1 Tax=Amylibacter marinus TaxID=1475483 RepID=A0ABQ5VWK0_9RHOB|nr:hypothetical protein [Amylibacter marinus]GLQ35567.1 hypothetical protein GCM10007939_18500 [Amylibacter marinus]